MRMGGRNMFSRKNKGESGKNGSSGKDVDDRDLLTNSAAASETAEKICPVCHAYCEVTLDVCPKCWSKLGGGSAWR
jgi:hypothetical protein